MNPSPFLADPNVLSLARIDLSGEVALLEVSAHRPSVPCPGCQQPSSSVHSIYQRTPQDLPWQGVAVKLKVRTRRFFCRNMLCSKRIFCERLGAAVAAYARRTVRLTQALTDIGFAIGAEAGARLTTSLCYGFGADTLLNVMRQDELSEHQVPRILGVDDWSFRKGKTFGTILVDLEQHKVIDLLPDRTAATFSAWLKIHPGVEIVSRDRSSDYAVAAKEAVPEAIQVADRWHLFKNLGDALEAWLGRHRSCLTDEVVESADDAATLQIAATWQLTPTQAKAHKARRAERVAQFKKAAYLRKQGLTNEVIASDVRVSIRTLRRWAILTELPERKKSAGRRSVLDPYKLYVERRWREGCEKPKTLWREITDQGFSGSANLVSNYLLYLRNVAAAPHTANTTPAPQLKRYLPRAAAMLFSCPEDKLGKVGKVRLKRLLETCPDAQCCYILSQQFTEMLRKRDSQPFENWLKAALASSVSELRRFANGIRLDRAAVEAALTLPYSNDQVEGQVNRLKLIKRSMYGRANFDLLKVRVLHSC